MAKGVVTTVQAGSVHSCYHCLCFPLLPAPPRKDRSWRRSFFRVRSPRRGAPHRAGAPAAGPAPSAEPGVGAKGRKERSSGELGVEDGKKEKRRRCLCPWSCWDEPQGNAALISQALPYSEAMMDKTHGRGPLLGSSGCRALSAAGADSPGAPPRLVFLWNKPEARWGRNASSACSKGGSVARISSQSHGSAGERCWPRKQHQRPVNEQGRQWRSEVRVAGDEQGDRVCSGSELRASSRR